MADANVSEPVAVHILDREYLVACEPHERAGLLNAASMVDARMRELKNASRTATVDRIAVLVALNLAHELLGARDATSKVDHAVNAEPDTLRARLDATLSQLTHR